MRMCLINFKLVTYTCEYSRFPLTSRLQILPSWLRAHVSKECSYSNNYHAPNYSNCPVRCSILSDKDNGVELNPWILFSATLHLFKSPSHYHAKMPLLNNNFANLYSGGESPGYQRSLQLFRRLSLFSAVSEGNSFKNWSKKFVLQLQIWVIAGRKHCVSITYTNHLVLFPEINDFYSESNTKHKCTWWTEV